MIIALKTEKRKPECRKFQLLLSTIFLILCLFFTQASIAASSRRSSSKKAAEPIVRVKLGGTYKVFSVAFISGGTIKDTRGRRLKSIRKGGVFKWEISKKNRNYINYRNKTLVFEPKDKSLKFNGSEYRGFLKIELNSKGASVVNHIGIEDYLRGVIGSEMGSLSPAESLKAQAVIARTYTYANKNRHGSSNADVCNSTHCQVYSGVKSERDSINKAVDSTRGIIMISDGKAISALYHATCGGMTSDNSVVWGGAQTKYLKRVVCPFCNKAKRYRWTEKISVKDLKAKLIPEKIYFSTLFDIDIESPSPLDRVTNVVLYTDKGIKKFRGTTLRRIFNLNSTTFVLGQRLNVTKKVVNALPAKISTKAKPKFIRCVGIVYEDIPDAPPQIVIQTSQGLKRALKPKTGWKAISWKEKLKQIEPDKEPVSVPQPKHQVKTEKVQRLAVKKNSRGGIDSIEIFGRGFGHQVGLCQSGAIELGKRGWTYRQILPYYYSHVVLRDLRY